MANNVYYMHNGKELFIRIPKNLKEGECIHLILPKAFAGQTLKVNIGTNFGTPFTLDTIQDSTTYAEMNYLGSPSYWKPEDKSYNVVAENPDCRWGQCKGKCFNEWCIVHKGTAKATPKKIYRLTSAKLREENEDS